MAVLSRLLAGPAEALDRRFGWDRLPRPLGIVTLVGLRMRLRERNLYDTETAAPKPAPPIDGADSRRMRARTIDGSFNDVDNPRMGSIGARFGRNVPLEHTFPDDLGVMLIAPKPKSVTTRSNV